MSKIAEGENEIRERRSKDDLEFFFVSQFFCRPPPDRLVLAVSPMRHYRTYSIFIVNDGTT